MLKRKNRADAALEAQIRTLGEKLARANADASQCADPVLFESLVYEIKYLQTRCSYFLKLARERGLYIEPGEKGRKKGEIWKKSSWAF